ncbi:NAD-dependent epimerase/dehydratase family protein [Gymnodinialimonas sp.]
MTDICIIGGSGFIGSAISHRLEGMGTPFSIVDQRPSPFYPNHHTLADITKPDTIAGQVKGSCIIHLAAVHRDDVRPLSRYDEVNVEGTRALCREAEAAGIQRIVFASSVAVYGFAEPGTDETGAVAPFNDYGRTKAEGEVVLKEWQAADPERRSLTIIRPTVVFGPGNRGNVYGLLRQIASGRFVMIGAGKNRKSMAYVENVADFFLYFTDAEPGVRIYNYIDGPDMQVDDLVRLTRREVLGRDNVGLRLPKPVGVLAGWMADGLRAVTGMRFPISRIRVKKFTENTAFTTALSNEHNFVPKVSLADGLKATIDAEFLNPKPDQVTFETE